MSRSGKSAQRRIRPIQNKNRVEGREARQSTIVLSAGKQLNIRAEGLTCRSIIFLK